MELDLNDFETIAYQKTEVIRELHDETGHRGRHVTSDTASRRYRWRGMSGDCIEFVKPCEECQRRANMPCEGPMKPTWSTTVWERVNLDVVYMPKSRGYMGIVFVRDDLSGWVEGRAITAVNSTKCPFEDMASRHG